MRHKYEESENDAERASLREDMKLEVRDRLARGELGDGASFMQGPVRIPRHLFPRDRQDRASIDWDAATLISDGHRFVRIRVSVPSRRVRRRVIPNEPVVGNADHRRSATDARHRGKPLRCKAPVIEDGALVLAESGAIIEYGIDLPAGASRAGPPGGSVGGNKVPTVAPNKPTKRAAFLAIGSARSRRSHIPSHAPRRHGGEDLRLTLARSH
jgi:hypothetical protein